MINNGAGRKVFFFNPEGDFYRTIIETAVDEEFEIYTLSRGKAGIRLASDHPDTLVLINMESPLKNETAALLMESESLASSLKEQGIILIPVYSERSETSEGLQRPAECTPICGAPLVLPASPAEAAARLIAFLEEKEARGQRRYVRFGAGGGSIAPLAISVGKKEFKGSLSDISSAAISFNLEHGTLLPVGTRIESFSLEIGKEMINLKGTVTLRRKNPDGTFLMVAMFDAPGTAARGALHRYIHASLQIQLYHRLKKLLKHDT